MLTRSSRARQQEVRRPWMRKDADKTSGDESADKQERLTKGVSAIVVVVCLAHLGILAVQAPQYPCCWQD